MPDLIALNDAKRWLDIDLADTTRDDLISGLVTAASETCLEILAWDPTLQTYSLIVDGYGGSLLPLNQRPIVTVTSVTLLPGTTPLPADQISIDDAGIYWLSGRFPRGKKNVQVVFTAGYASVPGDIQLALKFTVKAMWDARKTDMNVTGESFAGVSSASFWPTGPGSVPPPAMAILMRKANMMKV